jgi:hypothetical protein
LYVQLIVSTNIAFYFLVSDLFQVLISKNRFPGSGNGIIIRAFPGIAKWLSRGHDFCQDPCDEFENLFSSPTRTLVQFDLVMMTNGPWSRKDRCLFLFNDLLVITSIGKRAARDVRRGAA